MRLPTLLALTSHCCAVYVDAEQLLAAFLRLSLAWRHS
jgi:hypothetical protein